MKRNYWFWEDEISSDDHQLLLGKRPEIFSKRKLYFDNGELVNLPPNFRLPIIVDAESDGFLTDNLVCPSIPGLIVSSRLREVLDTAGIMNLQYFHVDLMLPNNARPSLDYYLANVVGKISCVNTEASNIVIEHQEGMMPIVDSARGISLDETRIPDLDIFRLVPGAGSSFRDFPIS